MPIGILLGSSVRGSDRREVRRGWPHAAPRIAALCRRRTLVTSASHPRHGAWYRDVARWNEGLRARTRLAIVAVPKSSHARHTDVTVPGTRTWPASTRPVWTSGRVRGRTDVEEQRLLAYASGGSGAGGEAERLRRLRLALRQPLRQLKTAGRHTRRHGAALGAPDFLGDLDDQPQLRQLLLFGQQVALDGRREAALRREAELIDRRVP